MLIHLVGTTLAAAALSTGIPGPAAETPVLVETRAIAPSPAIVIKNDGECGMPGSDADGEFVFGGFGLSTTRVENGNWVTLKCKGDGIVNLSDRGQSLDGFQCAIEVPSGGFVFTTDTHATVSRSGVGTLTCRYRK